MKPRFQIDEPLTPRERLLDYALGTVLAIVLTGAVSSVVALALLAMAR